MRGTNVLKILGVSSKEDVHANLFKYCIENSRRFREAFFESVLNWPMDMPLVGVSTRMSLPDIGLPDIVVVGNSRSNPKVGVVELKLHANEGADQTNRYASSECLRHILVGLELGPCSKPDLVFLTLYPNQGPENEEFRASSLRPLVLRLETSCVHDDAISTQLVQDWYECLGEFYSAGTLKDDDLLITKFVSGTTLDSGYLSFSGFFRSIGPAGLEPSGTWRSSPQGRPFYGIQYRKASWFPNEVPSGNWQKFEPSKHFDIHIECQFHRLQGVDCPIFCASG